MTNHFYGEYWTTESVKNFDDTYLRETVTYIARKIEHSGLSGFQLDWLVFMAAVEKMAKEEFDRRRNLIISAKGGEKTTSEVVETIREIVSGELFREPTAEDN